MSGRTCCSLVIISTPHMLGALLFLDLQHRRDAHIERYAPPALERRSFPLVDVPRLKEDEGGVPSTVAEAHRKQLQDMDDVVRKEQQVHGDGYCCTLMPRHVPLIRVAVAHHRCNSAMPPFKNCCASTLINSMSVVVRPSSVWRKINCAFPHTQLLNTTPAKNAVINPWSCTGGALAGA